MSVEPEGPAEPVDLVVFRLAGKEYAADLTQVRRIDNPDPEQSVGEPLGHPADGRRALVFATPQGERRLTIDLVVGVKRVDPGALRRMPRVVAAARHAVGAWLEGERTVLLIDLLALAAG